MAGRGVNGVALAATAAGVTFVYAGLSGNSILATLQSWVQGKAPSQGAINGGIGAAAGAAEAASAAAAGVAAGAVGGAASSVIGGALGLEIANDAQQYIGSGYHFGGAPAKGEWDCSSLVNKVVGSDLGLAIPFYAAGTYKGADHGPNTAAWLFWSGAHTIDRSAVQPGDLCCWQTHMGIAIGGGRMVSARSAHANPPTGVGDIASGGPVGEALFVRRLNAATADTNGGGGGGRGIR